MNKKTLTIQVKFERRFKYIPFYFIALALYFGLKFDWFFISKVE